MTVPAEPDDAAALQPLYQRIRSEIEGNIMSGRWPPGYRVPSELELTEAYACSRMTINKVLSALAAAGLVERRRRAGSFVSRPRVQSAVLQIPDMRAEIEGRGEEYGYELLGQRRRAATPDDRRRLGVTARVPVLALRCRHLTGGQPFALEDRLLNLGEVPDALNQDFSILPPNTWLVGHVPWTEAEHRITARGADDGVAAALDIDPGAACLVIERRTWWNGEPITAVQITHPGHLYDLVARFTPTG
jgi:GntR family histidine utilization transcriptional repressor